MICYLKTTRYNKIVFIISNIIAIVALYLTGIIMIIKMILFIGFFLLSLHDLKLQCSIKAFYLTTVRNKSLLLITPIKINQLNKTINDIQIKVNFVKVVYFSPSMVVLNFANQLKSFDVLIFKRQIDKDQFKALIILAKYGFLPV